MIFSLHIAAGMASVSQNNIEELLNAITDGCEELDAGVIKNFISNSP